MRPHHALIALAVVFVQSCGSDSTSDTGPDLDTRIARERVAALFEEDKIQGALELLRPLLASEEAEATDFLHAAILELQDTNLDAARAHAERALAGLPNDGRAHFVLGRCLKDLGELELAREHLGRAHELVPTDVPTELALATVLDDLDLRDEATAHYRHVLDADRGSWGDWMVSAAYRLGRLHLTNGEDEAYDAVRRVEEELRDAGFDVPATKDQLKGELGKVVFPVPDGTRPLGPPDAAPRIETAVGPPGLAGCEQLAAWTVGPDWREAERDDMGNVVSAARIGLPDLVGWGSPGLLIARGSEPVTVALETPVDALWPSDWNDDGWLDFVVVGAGVVTLHELHPDGTLRAGPVAPELPSAPRDARSVDFDHDGDVDLLLVGDFGARLWRNDGLTREGQASEQATPPGAGRFTDATPESGLPTNVAFTWCVTEDFDVDQDVDLLLGSAERAFLADDLRGGVFADRSQDLGGRGASAERPAVADVDGDELPDLLFPGEPGRVLFGTRAGPYRLDEARGGGASRLRERALVDLDLDGSVDVVGALDDRLLVTYSAGSARARTDALTSVAGARAVAWGDLDGRGAPDVAVATEGGVELHHIAAPPSRNGLRLALQGMKDNRRGVGAIVEVRAREVYRRIYWRGEPLVVGLGAAAAADIVRVTWPNGVVQNVFDTPAGEDVVIEQAERLAGSCPFLYTWNGFDYTFVSDVLGITPLGLPMAPGMLVPPDHDEYVLVTGEQLRPKNEPDGLWYDMQITEELREVTYLDQLRLLVVDHPEGSELYPNELFSFPPFPERHEHVPSELHAPLRAPGSDGRDWSDELAAIDGRFAVPFSGYQDQFQGLAPPWTIEVAFDPEVVRSGAKLRLVCTGWLLWSNASVNMAAARTEGIDFVPPILQVPASDADTPGGWRDTGPPVGFPAGKTKSMVLDVTDLVDPQDPRLRLFSTLCLYWDSIRLAIGDDEPTRITELEPVTAELWDRGFSEPINPTGEYKLEWFVWSRLADEPLWNQHPGLYTRYGETRPLLDAVDDQFVVLGAGDALHVRFDASEAPPLQEGWRRDYLLFLDGWAKDRDPNTVEALEVEPLPFHGMSGYPYGPEESFPDDEAHREWRKEWQTRPAKRWIEPLAPGL